MKKWILRVVVALAVIAAVSVGVLIFTVDTLARRAVEQAGTRTLGVPTTLASVDLGLLGGTCELEGLRVDNPQGYESPYFLDLKEAGVAVNLRSLRGDTVEVPSFKLTGLQMHLEKRKGKANFDVLLENMKKVRGQKGEPAPAPPEGEKGKQFIVRQIEIRDIHVQVDLLPIGGEISRTDVHIPELILTDVGSDSNHKATISQIMGVVVQAVLEAVVKKGVDLPGDLVADLSSSLGDLSDLPGEGLKLIGDTATQAGEALGEAAKNTGEAAEKALEGVTNLFGGNKKQQE